MSLTRPVRPLAEFELGSGYGHNANPRLFGKDSDTIGLHIRNIYKEGELEESATPEDSSVVQQEGRRKVARKVRFYILDAVISVG